MSKTSGETMVSRLDSLYSTFPSDQDGETLPNDTYEEPRNSRTNGDSLQGTLPDKAVSDKSWDLHSLGNINVKAKPTKKPAGLLYLILFLGIIYLTGCIFDPVVCAIPGISMLTTESFCNPIVLDDALASRSLYHFIEDINIKWPAILLKSSEMVEAPELLQAGKDYMPDLRLATESSELPSKSALNYLFLQCNPLFNQTGHDLNAFLDSTVGSFQHTLDAGLKTLQQLEAASNIEKTGSSWFANSVDPFKGYFGFKTTQHARILSSYNAFFYHIGIDIRGLTSKASRILRSLARLDDLMEDIKMLHLADYEHLSEDEEQRLRIVKKLGFTCALISASLSKILLELNTTTTDLDVVQQYLMGGGSTVTAAYCIDTHVEKLKAAMGTLERAVKRHGPGLKLRVEK